MKCGEALKGTLVAAPGICVSFWNKVISALDDWIIVATALLVTVQVGYYAWKWWRESRHPLRD